MAKHSDPIEDKLDVIWLARQLSGSGAIDDPRHVAVDRGWMNSNGALTPLGEELAVALKQQSGTRSTLRPFCTKTWR
jgi:hypothetical protein